MSTYAEKLALLEGVRAEAHAKAREGILPAWDSMDATVSKRAQQTASRRQAAVERKETKVTKSDSIAGTRPTLEAKTISAAQDLVRSETKSDRPEIQSAAPTAEACEVCGALSSIRVADGNLFCWPHFAEWQRKRRAAAVEGEATL